MKPNARTVREYQASLSQNIADEFRGIDVVQNAEELRTNLEVGAANCFGHEVIRCAEFILMRSP
jgi:hypothetical protein